MWKVLSACRARPGKASATPEAGQKAGQKGGQKGERKAGQKAAAKSAVAEAPQEQPQEQPQGTTAAAEARNSALQELLGAVRGGGSDALEATRKLRVRVGTWRPALVEDELAPQAGAIVALARDGTETQRVEALWLLANLASGSGKTAAALEDAGALKLCAEVLASADEPVAVWMRSVNLLGNLAGDGPAMRDRALELGVAEALADGLGSRAASLPVEALRDVAWAMCNLCRGGPALKQIEPLLQEIATYLDDEADAARLSDSLWALVYAAEAHPAKVFELGVLGRACALLDDARLSLVTPALRLVRLAVQAGYREELEEHGASEEKLREMAQRPGLGEKNEAELALAVE